MNNVIHAIALIVLLVISGYRQNKIGNRVNIDCIPDKLGTNYKGTVHVTINNKICANWFENVRSYLKFRLKGKTFVSNHCRNPDNDKNGPWCYLKKLYTPNFAYGYCNISLCKRSKQVNIGVDLRYGCPEGFNTVGNTKCLLTERILSELPSGSYALKAYGSYKCPKEYKEKKIGVDRYCVRNNGLSLSFPQYLKPAKGSKIFEVYLLSRQRCEPMTKNVSVIMTIHPVLVICSYYYRYNYNKELQKKDYRLVYPTVHPCPNNWEIIPAPIIDSKFRYCRPKFETKQYPEGQYCLMKSQLYLACPEGFIEVMTTLKTGSYCCRDGVNSPKLYYKIGLLEKMNLSSVVFLNSVKDLCKVSYKEKTDLNVVVNTYKNIYDDFLHCFDGSIRWSKKCEAHACIVEKKTTIQYAFIVETLSQCPIGGNKSFVRVRTNKGTKRFNFCLVDGSKAKFPDGDYCLFKFGQNCPAGFNSSSSESMFNTFDKVAEMKGQIPNLFKDSYCCKIRQDLNKRVFNKTDRFPFVKRYMKFGLPKQKCFHGYKSYLAFEDEFYCRYVPKSIYWDRKFVNYSPLLKCKMFHRAVSLRDTYSVLKFNRKMYCLHFYGFRRVPPTGKYCLFFKTKCPTYFYYLTYSPISGYIICCRDNSGYNGSTLYNWTESKNMTLIAYENKCPQMADYNLNTVKVIQTFKFRGVLNQKHKQNLTSIATFSKNEIRIYWCQYTIDTSYLSEIWPMGNYGLPKPMSGCQKGFKSGSVQHLMEKTQSAFTHSRHSMHWSGNYMLGWHKLQLDFCVKKSKRVFRRKRRRIPLPVGRYCVFMVGFRCPSKFITGYVKFLEFTTLHNSSKNFVLNGTTPNIEHSKGYIYYHFCCQDSITPTTMVLPTAQGPFYLLRYGDECQKVVGMRHTEEYMCIDAEDSSEFKNKTFKYPFRSKGLTPITGSNIRGCDFQLNTCYYEKYVPPKPTPPINFNSTWPFAYFGFLKPIKQKCPKGFKAGTALHSGRIPMFPNSAKRFFLDFQKDKAYISYCTRDMTGKNESNLGEWPAGNYCMIFDDPCPKGMYAMKLNFKIDFRIGSIMKLNKLCCQKSHNKVSHMPLFPSTHYSVVALIDKTGKFKCMKHYNKRVTAITIFDFVLCYYEDRRITSSGKTTTTITQFPPGNYLLPLTNVTNKSCPPDFHLIQHTHTLMGSNKNNDRLSERPKKLQLSFCTPNNTNVDKNTKQVFPNGVYCILTVEEVCPDQFNEDHILTVPGYYKKSGSKSFSHYLACCQSNSYNLIMNFDYRYASNDTTFAVYSNGLKCNMLTGHSQVDLLKRKTLIRSPDNIDKLISPPILENSEDMYDGFNEMGVCMYHWKPWMYIFRSQCKSCSINATCELGSNGPVCECKMGYFGNGEICGLLTQATDSCAGICSTFNSACVFDKFKDKHQCICIDGYKGDGFNCKPSCETRKCNSFSNCILTELESYCICKENSIENFSNGKCHGDLYGSLSVLAELNVIPLNFTCLTNHQWNFMIKPSVYKHSKLTILIPPNPNIYEKCEGINKYISVDEFALPENGVSWNTTIRPFDLWLNLISKDEANIWTVNKDITVNKSFIFTNAIVLMLNDEIKQTYDADDSDSHFSFLHSYDNTALYYVFAASIIISALIIAVILYIKRRQQFLPSRLDSQSMTNIVYNPQDDEQIVMVD